MVFNTIILLFIFLGVGNMQQMASLKNTLNQVMQQNSSLKSKLQQINLISQVDDLPQIPSIGITDTMIRGFGNPSLSYRYKKICYPKIQGVH